MEKLRVNRRQIRVRPIVRYAITDYAAPTGGPLWIGEFANADAANRVAQALAYQLRGTDPDTPIFLEAARQLRIDVQQGPAHPRPTVRYVLSEEAA
jgi:hypothetical protein